MRPLFQMKQRTGGGASWRWSTGLAGLVLAGLLGPNAFSAQQAQLPQVDVTQPFTSVFVDNPSVGKDPFFPRSKRRVSKSTTTTNLFVGVIEGWS